MFYACLLNIFFYICTTKQTKTKDMKTEIEIIRVDEANQKGFIIALRQDEIVVENITLGRVQIWNLEDMKQCIKFI